MNTKKIIAVILALAAIVGVFAACGGGNENTQGGASSYESSEAILNTVWGAFKEDQKFATIGGDIETAVNDAAGKIDTTNTENMEALYSITAENAAKMDAAASLTHMMNGNIFTAVAFHMAEGADMAALADSIKETVLAKHWLCGTPEEFVVIKVDGEYAISAYGSKMNIDNLKANAAEALAGSEILVEATIAEGI